MSDAAQICIDEKPFEDEKEKLYRAVYPQCKRPNFWKNGKLSSAAFKDCRGLSVERQYGRADDEVITYVKDAFEGNIVSIKVLHCNDINAFIRHLPSERSEFHSEIHGSNIKKVLSDGQAKNLARLATLECKRDE